MSGDKTPGLYGEVKRGTDGAVSMEMVAQQMAIMEQKINSQAALIAYWLMMAKVVTARLGAVSGETHIEVTTQDLKDTEKWTLNVGDPQGEDEHLKGQVVGLYVDTGGWLEKHIQSGGRWGRDGVRTERVQEQGQGPTIIGLDGRPLR